jgi:hypothetical protein
MLDALNRAERCRDLAEECRRVAALCASTEMRSHYSRMAEHYSTLAEAEELGKLVYGNPAMVPTNAVAGGLGARCQVKQPNGWHHSHAAYR